MPLSILGLLVTVNRSKLFEILITAYPLGYLIIFNLDENGHTLDLHADVFPWNTIFTLNHQWQASKMQIRDSEPACCKEATTLFARAMAKPSYKRPAKVDYYFPKLNHSWLHTMIIMIDAPVR